MITRTFYKNKKGQTWFLELDGLKMTSGTEGNAETQTFLDQQEITNAFNALLMKKIQEGFEFDRVETQETQEDIDAKTVDGVVLADNQFIVDFDNADSLKEVINKHVNNFHQYVDAVKDQGVYYGIVKNGEFVPHTAKSGDVEHDFYRAVTAIPELRPLVDEFVGMVANVNSSEEPRMRDKETPIGAIAAFANALADKQYLISYRRLVDSILPIDGYTGRFKPASDGGCHVPQLIKKWGYTMEDKETFAFLVAQLVNIQNSSQAEDTSILMNELGLAEALKDPKFLKKLYNDLMNRAAYIFDQNDVSFSSAGEDVFAALTSLGIKCSKSDAVMVYQLIDDIASYPSLEQMLAGNINEDDDFPALYNYNYDDGEEENDEDDSYEDDDDEDD